jgi:hypothetical protein
LACSLEGVTGEAGSTARIALALEPEPELDGRASVSVNGRLPLVMSARAGGGRPELEACVRFNGTYFPQSMRCGARRAWARGREPRLGCA